MKRFLLLFLFAYSACITASFAQTVSPVPNGDFETWTNSNEPDNWTLTQGRAMRMTEVINGTDTVKPYSGSSFLGLRTDTVNAQFFPGTLVAKFPFSTRPDVIQLYAMYRTGSPSVPENPGVAVVFTKWNVVGNRRDTIVYSNREIIGQGTNGDIYPWSLIRDSLVYRSPLNPDTANIYLFSTRASTVSIETIFYVDKIEFLTGISGIKEELANGNIGRVSCYPNPAKEKAIISCNLLKPSNLEVKLYDMTGREIRNIYSGNSPAGEQRMELNIADLQQGMYIYQVKAGETVSTNKLIINRD